MKHFTYFSVAVVIATFLTFNMLIELCDARGGRGRGGGSFGGIFGGWRKYKKPTSNSNSRRTISSSPMQTSATKHMPSGGPTQVSMNSMKQTPKQQSASYPKQQMPLGSGYNTNSGYNGNYAPGSPPLPPGGSYYPNMGAMPPGAIYYPQPMRSSSGTGDFLVGMLAGHMASNMLFGPRHYVTHVYHENANQNSGGVNPKVIVVNNGDAATTLNTTSIPTQHWPTDTDTPLEPFNESVTPSDAIRPEKTPFFPRNSLTSNPSNTQITETASQNPTPSVPQNPPANGIICVPVLLNETNPADPSKVQQVERVICFPAPPPAAPPSEGASANCAIRNIIETDPDDPSKTIEVPKEICNTPTTTLEPRKVAGEIGESAADDTTETSEANYEKETQTAQDGTDAEPITDGAVLGAFTKNAGLSVGDSKQ